MTLTYALVVTIVHQQKRFSLYIFCNLAPIIHNSPSFVNRFRFCLLTLTALMIWSIRNCYTITTVAVFWFTIFVSIFFFFVVVGSSHENIIKRRSRTFGRGYIFMLLQASDQLGHDFFCILINS